MNSINFSRSVGSILFLCECYRGRRKLLLTASSDFVRLSCYWLFLAQSYVWMCTIFFIQHFLVGLFSMCTRREKISPFRYYFRSHFYLAQYCNDVNNITVHKNHAAFHLSNFKIIVLKLGSNFMSFIWRLLFNEAAKKYVSLQLIYYVRNLIKLTQYFNYKKEPSRLNSFEFSFPFNK